MQRGETLVLNKCIVKLNRDGCLTKPKENLNLSSLIYCSNKFPELKEEA